MLRDYQRNQYLTSLLAAYVATLKCGLSIQNVDYENKLIRSIARCHLHFHMAGFLEDPKRFESYVTPEDIEFLQPRCRGKRLENIIRSTTPGRPLIIGVETLRVVIPRKLKRYFRESLGRLCVGIEHPKLTHYSSQLGIQYQIVTDVNPGNSATDYTRFVMAESNGLTMHPR